MHISLFFSLRNSALLHFLFPYYVSMAAEYNIDFQYVTVSDLDFEK